MRRHVADRQPRFLGIFQKHHPADEWPGLLAESAFPMLRNNAAGVMFEVVRGVFTESWRVEQNKNTARHASREPYDINDRVSFVSYQIASGNCHIIPDHRLTSS